MAAAWETRFVFVLDCDRIDRDLLRRYLDFRPRFETSVSGLDELMISCHISSRTGELRWQLNPWQLMPGLRPI